MKREVKVKEKEKRNVITKVKKEDKNGKIKTEK